MSILTLRRPPLLSQLRPVRCSVALVVLVVLTAGSALGADGGRSSDPAGDVKTMNVSVNADQRSSVDIRRVRYVVGSRRLTITTTVVDLKRFPNLAQFAETRVSDGAASLVLTTELGTREVKVFTGSSLATCRGSSVTTDYERNSIKQRLPLRCLRQFDSISMRSRTSLHRFDATQLAVDRAVRTEAFLLG